MRTRLRIPERFLGLILLVLFLLPTLSVLADRPGGWPNDLYYRTQELGGDSVEQQTHQTGTTSTYGGGRDGQRLAINDRNVSKLAFYTSKVGAPSGDVTFTIRKVSDDSIIVSKVWGDASALSTDLTWEEVVFDSPVRIQDEVRIAIEFDGGDAANLVRSGAAGNVKGSELYTYWDSPGGTEWADLEGNDFCYKYTYTLPPDEFTIDIGYDISATAHEWQRKTFKNPRGLGYYYALIRAPGSSWRIHKSLNGSSWSVVTNTPEILTETPPALCIYEDEANSRLIVYLVYKSDWYIFALAKTIEDDSSDFTSVENFWWAQVGVRTEDGVYFPNICIDDSGYLWFSWTDEFTNGGKQRNKLRVTRSTTVYPVTAPSWETIVDVYGEAGGEYSKGLRCNTGPYLRSELIPLTATADVGCVFGYYDDDISEYALKAVALTYSAGINKGTTVTLDGTVHTDLIHSSVAESGVNSDVFIVCKDADGSFKCIKWDVSAASSAAFGTVFASTVDSLALSIDKNSSPDKLYAFYVKSGVQGDVFYKTSGVDSASWSSEEMIDDDTQSLDYISASYQDWALDGDVQIIYTRQTWRRVRFWAAGVEPEPEPEPGPGPEPGGGSGMEQVIFGGGDHDLLDPITTEYNTLIGGAGWGTTEFYRYKLVSTDGIIKNLRVVLDGSPGAGNKYTFTLMVNGAPSALTFDIAGAATSGSNMVNEIDVTGGDYVYLRCVPDSDPTARRATWTSVFEGDTSNESLILGGSGVYSLNKYATEYGPVMCAATWYGIPEDDVRQVCPTAGTIKNFYVRLDIDPGTAPDAYRLTLRKNGISQTLTVTITADDTTGSDLVNTVDVVAGDVLTLIIEPLNGPTTYPYACWGMTFVADTDGESIVLGGCYEDLDAAATEYNTITGFEARPWDADETQRYLLGQVCTLKKLHILLSGSPGAGSKYDFTLRIAGADSNVVATVSGTDTTGNSGALTDTVANDDYVTLQVVPDSTPNVADAYWGFVCYIAPPAPPVTVTQTFLSTTTIDETVCIYTVVQVIIDPITTVTTTSGTLTTLTTETTSTCISTYTETTVTECTTTTETTETECTTTTETTETQCTTTTETTVTECITTTITTESECITTTITTVSECTTTETTDTECTTTTETTDTECTTTTETTETQCTTTTETTETYISTCITTCETSTVTHTTECDTICETSISTSETTTTSCETITSTFTSESTICTTTSTSTTFTTSITTTFTTGDITTTTVVQTVVYDGCVTDSYDDTALMQVYDHLHHDIGAGEIHLIDTIMPSNTTDLEGRWGFNEGSGSTAEDTSGNDLDGVITGATYIEGIDYHVVPPSGFLRYALRFNDIEGDFVNITYGDPLNNSLPYSVEFWFRPRLQQVNVTGTIVSGGYAFLVYYDNATESIIMSYYDGADWETLSSAGGLGTGYTYVVCMWEDATPKTKMSMYFNATIRGVAVERVGMAEPLNTHVYIGRNGTETSDGFLSGDLDVVRYYNRTLTSDEMDENFIILASYGVLYSTNMLDGLNVTQVVNFKYNAVVYTGGDIYFAFSQDNATWVGSGGILGTETAVNGSNSILLTGLDWSGNFYYRAQFNRTAGMYAHPRLCEVAVCYSTTPAGAGWNILVIVGLVAVAAVLSMAGMKKRW